MLTGIHFLLSYTCIFECDHCFVFSGPSAEGTFTNTQIRDVLDDAAKIETMEWIYFEGGEPMLFYPLLLEGAKLARQRGFKVGIVTNAYFASSDEGLDLWLEPLAQLGISDLSVSDDPFHHGESERSPAIRLAEAAAGLGIPVSSICIDAPTVDESAEHSDKGKPVIGGNVLFKGRAVEKLIEGLPRKHWSLFNECPHEELVNPERVHIDSYGNAQPCQGISIGNIWERPLSQTDKSYNYREHPICGKLVEGGPARLITDYSVDHEEAYVDACHCCYMARKSLLGRFPDHLAPRQVYGVVDD